MIPSSAAPVRPASWKWWITGLLLLATMINYMDRVTLANASVRVTEEMQLNDQQYGNLELAFGWAFAAGSLVFGILADRWRIYFLYPAVLACWSIMGVVSGFSQGFTGLLVCRALLGFFEAGHWPCALKTTFALLNEKDRTMGNSVLQSGASIGAVLTPQIMKYLMTTQNGTWRTAFIVVGATGLLWVALWFLFLRPRDLDGKRGEVPQSDAPGLGSIVCSRRFWALALLITGAQTVWHIPRVWLMKFLQTGRGFEESAALNFNSLYYIATDIGCVLAGFLSVWLIRRRGTTPHDARRMVYAGACVLTSLSVFIPSLGKGWLLLTMLLFIGAGALALFPCYYSFVQELSDRHVGRLTGLLSMWVWAVTSPLHSAFGWLADRTKTYDTGLVIAGLAPWIGVIAMKFLWRRKETLQRTQSARSSADDSSIPEAWLRHIATRPAPDSASGMGTAGAIIAAIGVAIAAYFFFIYDTSVSTESQYIQGYGTVAGQRVHNQGLMQNRLLGCVGGMVVAAIGSVMVISSRRSS